MKASGIIHRTCFYFSHWSKKGYSIFAGLGHEVKISPLAIHMYGMVLLKNAVHGLIVNTDAASDLFPSELMPALYRTGMTGCRGEVCPAAWGVPEYSERMYGFPPCVLFS